jgi:hypothetical protein
MPRFVLLLGLAFVPGCASDPPAPAATQAVVDALRDDLRTIMTRQERYYSQRGHYAATLDLLRANGVVELTSGGEVELVGAPGRFTVSISSSVGAGGVVTCRVAIGTGEEDDGKIECS